MPGGFATLVVRLYRTGILPRPCCDMKLTAVDYKGLEQDGIFLLRSPLISSLTVQPVA